MAFNDIVRRGPLSLTAAAALTQGYLVKLDTSAKAALAGSGDVPLGVVSETVASGDTVSVEPCEGVVKLVASAAISIGDYVCATTGGKVAKEDAPITHANTPTAFTIGQAITAATTDGDAVFVASLR
jgi:hypothetical protein